MSTVLLNAIANQSYNKLQVSQEQASSSTVNTANNFQKLFKAEFNKFASMSPAEISNYMKNRQPSIPKTNAVANIVSAAADKVHKNEAVIKRSLIGKASTIELMHATNEVKNALTVAKKLRDQAVEAFDKIMNMPI